MYKSADLPEGLRVAKVLSEKMFPEKYNLEYLEFTKRKYDQICNQVIDRIIEALGYGKSINLIVPLNGGLLFYRTLMDLLLKRGFYADSLNVLFCDEDETDSLKLSGIPFDPETSYNLVIDDIWDKGDTGAEIWRLLNTYGFAESLDYFAFCQKSTSPQTNEGARIANPDSIVVFEPEWLHGWGGMDSSVFNDPKITALERTSYLPLIPTGTHPKFDPEDSNTRSSYIDLMTHTNLAVNGVIPIQVYYDILFLEQNPNLQTRFEYLAGIHKQYLYPKISERVEVES